MVKNSIFCDFFLILMTSHVINHIFYKPMDFYQTFWYIISMTNNSLGVNFRPKICCILSFSMTLHCRDSTGCPGEEYKINWKDHLYELLQLFRSYSDQWPDPNRIETAVWVQKYVGQKSNIKTLSQKLETNVIFQCIGSRKMSLSYVMEFCKN